MIVIEDIGDDFSDVIFEGESIGIVEPGNIVRLSISLEDCVNNDWSFDEIIQFRKKVPKIKQSVIDLGYKLEKEIEGVKDIDEESIENLKLQYDDCF